MAADWGKIESDYMAGKLSYREIAQKYGLDPSTVARRGKKEGWVEKRQRYASKIHARARSKAASKRAAREAETLAAVSEVAQKLLLEIQEALRDDKQLRRHVISISRGKQGERVLKKMDTKAVVDLANASRLLLSVLRDVEGMPTLTEREQMALARDRLALDREKAAMGQVDESETGVVELAPVEDAGDVREVIVNAQGDLVAPAQAEDVHVPPGV